MMKIHGFKFPVGLMTAETKIGKNAMIPNPDGLCFMDNESFSPVPSSAWAVFIGLLSKCDDRGILRSDFNLQMLADLMDISYNTIYSGFQYLLRYRFVYEEVRESESVYVINHYEKYNTPENPKFDRSLNYFIVPYALFETSILAEFVRTSNPSGIKFMLSLFNRFRTAIVDKEHVPSLKYKMSTLKQKLNKKAKGVRGVLQVLSPLFNLQMEEISFRGSQVWLKSVKFQLKEECVKENTDEFEIDSLLAKYRKEVTYLLDGHDIRHRLRDIKDVILSFKQEVVNNIKYMYEPGISSTQKFKERDDFYHDVFIQSLENIEEELRGGQTKIRSIGAYFRVVFRNQFLNMIKGVPRELIHFSIFNEYTKTGGSILKAKQIF